MALNSINTNISAYYAQQNIGRASNLASVSVARLSSGNRIINASDDVSGLAAGTSLRTNVTTLKTALINTAQGSSLLQVADGALGQIVDILQRQKAIGIQAGSGSLDDTARGFLNQEFQQLSAEIDRIATTTNFNGVNLIDGTVFDKNVLASADSAAGAASLAVQVVTFQTGKTLIVNGVTVTGTAGASSGNNYYQGTDASTQIDSLVTFLNSHTNTAINQAVYSRNGNSLVVTARAAGGGVGRGNFTFDVGTYGVANLSVAGNATGTATRFLLQGGTDVGLARGRTVGRGTIGDSLLLNQSQIRAQQVLSYDSVSTANLTTTFANKAITFGGIAALSFTFTTAPVGSTQIQIGSTVAETLRNAVSTISNYKNTLTVSAANNETRYVLDQVDLEVTGTGSQIIIGGQGFNNVITSANTAVTVLTNVTGASPGAAVNFNTATATGISTDGVINDEFVGTVSGFQAQYNGTSNTVNLSITVGGTTYNAYNVNTQVTANTTVRFLGANGGGYFDVDFAANQGTNVNSQADADVVAARLDSAFSGLSFYQSRDITSYQGAGSVLTNGVVSGSLTGSSIRFSSNDFSEVNLQDIKVQAPAPGTTNGSITFTINGETYSSNGAISNTLGAFGLYRFTSASDANKFIEFRAGNTNTFFRTADEAQALEDALKDAFGFGQNGTALNFQVGTSTADTLSISIGTASTDKLFGGQSIDVLTQANAAAASDVLDDAIDKVISLRADVGAYQSRFGYATANVESSLQNQDAARAVFLDADIAAESTAFANNQVKLQAGISVLAQANQLQQVLLKLIG